MSKFMDAIIGAVKSNSNQMNGLFAALWAALLQTDVISQHPDWAAILGGIQAVLNIVQRSRKGHAPITERAKKPLING